MDNYKAALERARKAHKETESAVTAGILEEIFPELKESEDERIRKAMLIYLDWLDGRNEDYLPKGGYTIKEMLTWLERQKPVERGWLTKQEEYTLNRIIEYLEDNDCQEEWKQLLLDIHNLPYQKSVEWSEEDECMLEGILAHLEDAVEANMHPKYERWLKSLRPKKHWKPSIEQLRALAFCIKNECLDSKGVYGAKVAELLEQLKQL